MMDRVRALSFGPVFYNLNLPGQTWASLILIHTKGARGWGLAWQ